MLDENINFRAFKFISFSSAVPLLKIYSKEILLKTEIPLFTKMFTVLLMIIGGREKKLKCLPLRKLIMWVNHNVCSRIIPDQ